MDKRKFETKKWHHRVPDFELVYCGYPNPGDPSRGDLQRGSEQEHRLKRRKSVKRTNLAYGH